MTIETRKELEQARIALERRSPHVLAAFILSLIDAPNGIGNYVHMFAVADDPKAAADLLGGEIAFLRKGERDYDVRHRQGSAWVRRVDRTLDAIETALLPKDRGAAFHLLTSLVNNEPQISEHCHGDEFGAAAAFERARQLLKLAERVLSDPTATTALRFDSRWETSDESCGSPRRT